MAILQDSNLGGSGGRTDPDDETENLLKQAGQQLKSSGGGSKVLASGGDPVSASMSASPGSSVPNIETAQRLLESSLRTSPEPKNVVRNVKQVLRRTSDPGSMEADSATGQNTQGQTAGGGIVGTATDVATGEGGGGGFLGGIADLAEDVQNETGGLLSLPVLALAAVVLFFLANDRGR